MKKVYAEMILLPGENDWRFQEIPEDLLSMTGFTADEFQKKYAGRFLPLFSEKEIPSLITRLREIETAEKILPDFYQLNNADKINLRVQIQAGYLPRQNRLRVCITDVTSFAEKYDALKSQLNSLENACPGGLCKIVMDDRHTIIWHNQTFLDIIGYTEEQFEEELHSAAQGYIHPDDEEARAEDFDGLKNLTGQSVPKEVRIVRRDKEIRTLIVVFSRANETYHGIPVFYSSGLDITESKRAQQLALETERFQIAIRQTSSCVWEYDIAQRRILASESLQDLLKIDGEQNLIPETMIAEGIVCPESAENFRRLFSAASTGTDRVEEAIELRKSDGSYIWVKISMTCILNDAKIPIKAIAMMEDITEKYNLEQKYQEEERRRASMTFSLLFACQLNLTRDTVPEANAKVFPSKKISKSASALIQQYVRNRVHPDDKLRYIQTLGCDSLIEDFQHGVSEHSLEYRLLNEKGNYCWRRTMVHVVQEPQRGEILAYMYMKDIDEQKSMEMELRKRAELDGLTGLLNRYALEAKCRRILEENGPRQASALLEVEMEGLRNVNDNYGHAKGDALLKQAAEILKSEFTQNNAIIGYMGGDGFLIFFSRFRSMELLQQKTDRVCREISQAMEHYGIAASVGVAFFPKDGANYESLYQCADIALSYAKRLGRHRCVFYETSMKAQTGTDMLTVSREWLLDEANDIIYIADIHTYELLYMNSNMKKLFHQDDSYKGQKCYKVLQGFDAPCEFCTTPLLSRDAFYHWNYYNSLIGQSLILKDRIVDWYGQPARIEFATNVTELDSLRIRAEKQNKTILSSIHYASKIQKNLLPGEESFKKAFSDFSVIWKPRDVVGGDIYWLGNFRQGSLLCVGDCTGHGTPGALLTMLVASTLKDVVNEQNCEDTAEVLHLLDSRIANVLNVNKAITEENKNGSLNFNDGCDLAALFIAKDGSVTISSGNINIFICNGKEINRLKGQKLHIGEGKITAKQYVASVVIPAGQDNSFYIASDGLYDQIGGEPARPFGYKTVQEIILKHHGESQASISEKIWRAFENHRGSQIRRDDVELISFKI